MEENFRRAVLMSRGDMATFVESPISATLLVVALVLLVVSLLPALRRSRDEVFTE